MDNYYSIKENELIVHDSKKQPLILFLKYATWGVIVFLISCSLIFKDNFFLEINKNSLLFLIALFISTLFIRRKQVPYKSEFELRLYEDKLVFYRPRIVYSPRMIRREENAVLYKDLEKIVYRKTNNSCYIYGDIHIKWTKYQKENNEVLEDIPYKDTKINKTLLFFNTNYIEMDKFIKDIEAHSSIKIIQE